MANNSNQYDCWTPVLFGRKLPEAESLLQLVHTHSPSTQHHALAKNLISTMSSPATEDSLTSLDMSPSPEAAGPPSATVKGAGATTALGRKPGVGGSDASSDLSELSSDGEGTWAWRCYIYLSFLHGMVRGDDGILNLTDRFWSLPLRSTTRS